MNICGMIYVNSTYTDGHMIRNLRILAEMVLLFSLTVMVLHNGQDAVTRLNIFEAPNQTNEDEVSLKICGILFVSKTFKD